MTSTTSRCSTPSTSGSRCACAREREHTTLVRDLDLPVHFDAGEEIRTEISAKFTAERIEATSRRPDSSSCGCSPTRTSCSR